MLGRLKNVGFTFTEDIQPSGGDSLKHLKRERTRENQHLLRSSTDEQNESSELGLWICETFVGHFLRKTKEESVAAQELRVVDRARESVSKCPQPMAPARLHRLSVSPSQYGNDLLNEKRR